MCLFIFNLIETEDDLTNFKNLINKVQKIDMIQVL